MSLPVILRHEAEVDVQEARDQPEALRVGLGTQVLARVREIRPRPLGSDVHEKVL